MDIIAEPIVEQATGTNPTNPIFDAKALAEADTKPEVVETAKPEVKEDPIPKGVQKRIDRAVREKYEAQTEARMLKERIAALESYRQPQQKTVDNDEPKIENFNNFDEYVAAKAEYIADKKINSTLSERDKRQAAERETTERTKTVESWNKRLAAATVEIPDFEDVVASSDVPMTQPMQQAIMESDIGPKLAYYLASNPEEAERIAAMSPIGAIRTLGRIEERLATAKPEVKTTNAPAPIKPIGSRATVAKDPGKMSDAEYERWRKSAA